jgi:hypothetical protein
MRRKLRFAAATFFAGMMVATKSFGADGKIADWGPLKFGVSFDQVRAVAPEATALAADDHDPEIMTSQISGAKFANADGSLSVRFYKDRAFEFIFVSINGLETVVPRAAANMSQEDKMATYCPIVFDVALDLLSVSYGKADEILRPSDLLRLDRTQSKSYRTSWWFSDGSRARLILIQGNAGICSEFISIKSARYAKAYVPEIVTGGSK